MLYDGAGPVPIVLIDSPDGQIELRGAEEIALLAFALHQADRLAMGFRR